MTLYAVSYKQYIISPALQNNKHVQKWSCESYDSYSTKSFLTKMHICKVLDKSRTRIENISIILRLSKLQKL
jgi:hypothetical protein